VVERNDEMLMKFKQVGMFKSILIILVIICALVGVGYGVYKNMTYKSTPEYSLKLIYDVIQNGDEETLKKLIDIDILANRRYEKKLALYRQLINEGKEKEILFPYKNRKVNLAELEHLLANDRFNNDIHTIFTGGDVDSLMKGESPNARFVEHILMLREVDRFKLISLETYKMSSEQISVVIVGLDTKDNNLKSLSLEMKQLSDGMWKIVWYDFASFGFPDLERDYN